MRLMAEGTIGLTTGSTVTLCPGLVGAGAMLWVGPGDANAAVARIGKAAAPQIPVEASNIRGFTLPESDPGAMVALGSTGDILRYAVWG